MEEKLTHIKNILKEVLANPPSGDEALNDFLTKRATLILHYADRDKADDKHKSRKDIKNIAIRG